MSANKGHDWDLIRRTVGADLNDTEFAVFRNAVERTGLDPMGATRQILPEVRTWWNKRAGQQDRKLSIVTTIDGLRVIAQRTGAYEGQTAPQWCGPDGKWCDVWLDSAPPAAARIGVYRRSFREPLYAIANWAAYAQTSRDGKLQGWWSKGGPHMLAKVAEALALRKAFPQETSGLYTDDEMAQSSVPSPARTDHSKENARQVAREDSDGPRASQQGAVAAVNSGAGGQSTNYLSRVSKVMEMFARLNGDVVTGDDIVFVFGPHEGEGWSKDTFDALRELYRRCHESGGSAPFWEEHSIARHERESKEGAQANQPATA